MLFRTGGGSGVGELLPPAGSPTATLTLRGAENDFSKLEGTQERFLGRETGISHWMSGSSY